MATIIAVAQLKGGEGKTTTASAIGPELAQRGYRVLLIDSDPQSNLTFGFGFKEDLALSLYHAYHGQVDLAGIIVKVGNYDLAPASLSLSGVEVELSSKIGRERLLERLIAPIKANYDFIVIDCPPSIGLLTVNALACCDHVLVPMQAEIHSLQGLRKISEIMESVRANEINKELSLLGIVLNKFDKRKILHQDIYETIKEEFPGKLFDVRIRTNIALAEAQIMGQDIFQYDMGSNGANDFKKLSEEITKRLNI